MPITQPSLARRVRVSLFLLILLLLPAVVAQAQTTYTVTNTNDSGAGSLRNAITNANDSSGLPADTIKFDISGIGPHTIQPTTALPTITDPVEIDGTTEPDYSGSPLVELDGTSAPSGKDGLFINTDDAGIRGLSIINFDGQGVDIVGSRTTVAACYLGLSADSSSAGNGRSGISVDGDENLIGTLAEARNVISANGTSFGHGISISGGSSNVIQHNYIGVDPTGATPRGNDVAGVFLASGPTLVGGTATPTRNVISGNNSGIQISSGSDNIIQGNYIGTDAMGDEEVGNVTGVLLFNAATDNHIGGSATGAGNVIASSTTDGIRIFGSSTTGNAVQGNLIGLAASGTSALPNHEGIAIEKGASNNRIGGTTSGAANTISGNDRNGIVIGGNGTTGNEIISNFIGLTPTGGPGVGNGDHGITLLDSSSATTIGGMTGDSLNVIGENGEAGINLHNTTSNVDIVGNRIGTGVAESDLRNGRGGVFVNGADHLITKNVLGYAQWGIRLGGTAQRTVVQGNYVGVAPDGTDIGHKFAGIRLSPTSTSAPTNNIIGTTTSVSVRSDHANVVANNDVGIAVEVFSGQHPINNAIRGNEVFANTGLGIDLEDDGQTANDAGDGDDGAHRLQNSPVIDGSGYDASADDVTVTYRVSSDPSLTGDGAPRYPLTVDFYRADADASEGSAHIGSDTYSSSDYTGCGSPPCPTTASFTPSAAVTESDHVVATATDADGNTSEFSATGTPLPVELVSFRAEPTGDRSVRLSWSTASETNNARFQIQRRETQAPSTERDSAWTTIGAVEGAGTTRESRTYRQTDDTVPFDAQRLQYRLAQFDLDGGRTIVANRVVELGSPQRTALRAPAPNPARGSVTLTYSLSTKQDAVIALYDALGRAVRTVTRESDPGRHKIQLATQSLAPGTYFVRLTTDSVTDTRRLVIVR